MKIRVLVTNVDKVHGITVLGQKGRKVNPKRSSFNSPQLSEFMI